MQLAQRNKKKKSKSCTQSEKILSTQEGRKKLYLREKKYNQLKKVKK